MTKTARCALTMFVLLAACGEPPEPRTSNNSVAQLATEDIDALRAAYHERLRLGLGSPFRLIEIVTQDERLDAGTRQELAAQLFERVLDGESYQAVHALPSTHQRIIEYALGATGDPRVGELAVNLAYEIAALEGSVTRELQYAASSTAALLRDRVLAQRDARHLQEWARTHDLEPLRLIPAWRAQHVFLVEQPNDFPEHLTAHEEASRLALLFIGGVRQAASIRGVNRSIERTVAIAEDDAARVLALPGRELRPPSSALIMAMRQARLPFGGRDEESFVAELGVTTLHADANVAAQRAAVALRPLAQERIWQDTVAPSAANLLVEFGVRVVFSPEVPAAWHPHYRRVLGQALTDLRAVLPRFSTQGLTIEFAEIDTAAVHVAFHDPGRRVIRVAPHSVSGSLAHELGHDLDWQIARRSYGRRATYASDYAVDVAAAMTRTTPGERLISRPTEILAQQFEWLIYALLSAQGRMNATLTTVQHEWLPGYGGAQPPVATVQSANAFAGLIERGVRLERNERDAIERAILASNLPASVHAVRAARSGEGRFFGAVGAGPYTRAYIDAVFVAAGLMRLADEAQLERGRVEDCGPFTLRPCWP